MEIGNVDFSSNRVISDIEFAGATAFTGTVAGLSTVNKIINGNFDIDSTYPGIATEVTDGYYMADVFKFRDTDVAARATYEYNISSSVPDGNSQKSLQIEKTSPAPITFEGGEYVGIETYIEGYDYSPIADGKYITLSFYVYSTLTGSYSVAFRNAAEDRTYVSTYYITTANDWERHSITLVTDTSGTWNTTNGIGMIVRFVVAAKNIGLPVSPDVWSSVDRNYTSTQVNWAFGSNNTFRLSQVKLESSTLASTFVPSHIPDEKERMSRIYRLKGPGLVGSSSGTVAIAVGSSFEREMRIAPTCSVTDSIRFTEMVNPQIEASGVPTNVISTMSTGGGLVILDGYSGLTTEAPVVVTSGNIIFDSRF